MEKIALFLLAVSAVAAIALLAGATKLHMENKQRRDQRQGRTPA